MRPKSKFFKYVSILISLLFFMESLPVAAAEMEDYCVVPPYVKRDVAPNIMILMDNSLDMLNPAYTAAYTPNATKDNYAGYFKPRACYRYSNQKFEEVYKSTSPDISYTYTDTCPSTTAPFRGNLMNWVTTSKFDLLQKVIIGGNAVSKQGNAHTLLSISGSWPDKTYNGCIFKVNNANLIITESTLNACPLIRSTPVPIASLQNQQMNILVDQTTGWLEKTSVKLSHNFKKLADFAKNVWESLDLVSEAWAAPCTISVDSSLSGTVGQAYSLVLSATGDNAKTYTWSFSPSPPAPFLTGPTYTVKNRQVTWTGTPATAGNYTFTATVFNDGCTSASITRTIVIAAAPLTITTLSIPNGTAGVIYSFTLQGTGGIPPYGWTVTGLPSGLSYDPATGVIGGTPLLSGGPYPITVTLMDANGTTAPVKNFSMTIAPGAGVNSQQFDVRVILIEEPLSDLNGNDIYDPGSSETFTDLNANGKWDGKVGVFQKYWDTINPRARWGLTKYTNQGVTIPSSGCIPVAPASSFYTTIQNAQPETVFPLASGLYGDINYYGFSSSYFPLYDSNSYNGCGNSDPIDNMQCRKNFVLILSSGSNVTGSNFLQSDCVVPNNNNSAPLVQNACYGYKNDLRTDKGGKQNVFTYVVNTLGVSNEAVLEDAAIAGNGNYYDARDPSKLESQLDQAFKDMLARAASGTAASVLASGEGQGANLVQAVFYPRTQKINAGGIFDTEIMWIGRLTNLWYYVDPFFKNSSIREDTTQESPYRKLNLVDDYIARLYYDSSAEQTKASRWSDNDGDGDADTARTTVTLENLKNLWEAGLELWRRDINTSPRTLYTTTGADNDANGHPDLINFSTGNAALLQTNLRAADTDEAQAIIKYVHGEDNPTVGSTTYSYRERTTGIDLNGDGDTTVAGESAKVWKLGDVLNSTPKISSWIPLNTYDQVYGDTSYKAYLGSSTYQDRGLVFAGGNDGMFHAFKLGKLELPGRSGNSCTFGSNEKACLYNDNVSTPLGNEVWSFIPKNALPYLRYMADPGYCHVFTVDLTAYVFDASIGDLGSGDISNSSKPNDGSTWRTIIIGGMRFGGACRNYNSACTDCVKTPIDGVGYSSYFALDITNQNSPTLLWEFSDPNLGFTTTGPSVVRIGADRAKNGKWFVVFGSGPTGPISTDDQQFLGRSDQNLRVFVLDLKNGSLQRTIDTTIQYAFAGSMLNATHDADLNYQDDVVYIPYVKKDTVAGTWTQGGVGRLLTKEDESPSNWAWSQVIDNIGPVTSAVVRLQHKTKKTLWLYFGTGRYYFEQIATVDDQDGQRRLFGITEPCFQNGIFNASCTTSRTTGQLSSVNVTSSTGIQDDEGWYINLDTSLGSYRAERVITDPLTTTTGIVFFTTYKPYNDVCSYGGKSFIWALKYDTGAAPGALLKGVALLQVSTGSIEQVDLSTAFTEKSGRRTGALEGVPPTSQGLSLMTTPPPVKRVIHMRER